jgi:putative aldouronate transport system substrate-binding protein
VFTGEENDEISEIKSTLSTYVSESIARFITGDLSIENDWEAYLNELDALGLERFLEVCQAAYDRMN